MFASLDLMSDSFSDDNKYLLSKVLTHKHRESHTSKVVKFCGFSGKKSSVSHHT